MKALSGKLFHVAKLVTIPKCVRSRLPNVGMLRWASIFVAGD